MEFEEMTKEERAGFDIQHCLKCSDGHLKIIESYSNNKNHLNFMNKAIEEFNNLKFEILKPMQFGK